VLDGLESSHHRLAVCFMRTSVRVHSEQLMPSLSSKAGNRIEVFAIYDREEESMQRWRMG